MIPYTELKLAHLFLFEWVPFPSFRNMSCIFVRYNLCLANSVDRDQTCVREGFSFEKRFTTEKLWDRIPVFWKIKEASVHCISYKV